MGTDHKQEIADTLPLPRLAATPAIDVAEHWVEAIAETIGLGFHPDTRAGDYISTASGMPLLDPETQVGFDDDLGTAFKVLGDRVYEVGLRVHRQKLARLVG